MSEGKYTEEHVEEMLRLLNKQNLDPATPITYPVRAGIAAQSLEEMLHLVNISEETWPNSSLTLWSSVGDPVDLTQLKNLIVAVGRHRCFTDLPFEVPE